MNYRDLTLDEIKRVQSDSHHHWGGRTDLTARIAKIVGYLKSFPSILRYVGLVDSTAQVLCSAKLFNGQFRVGESIVKAVGIAAVFTPEKFRSQGFAAKLIEKIKVDAIKCGAEITFLWSEIGKSYYAGMGYQALVAHNASIGGADYDKENDHTLRSASPNDIPAMMEIFHSNSERKDFSISRSLDWWKLLRELNSGSDYVAERGGQVQAYLCVEPDRDSLWLNEAFKRRESEVDIKNLTVLLSKQLGFSKVRFWPQAVPELTADIDEGAVTSPIAMIKCLSRRQEIVERISAGSCFLGAIDHF